MMGCCSSDLRAAMRNNDVSEMERILRESDSDLVNEDTTADCCLDWCMSCCGQGYQHPLYTATMKQNSAMVKLLLDYHAEVNTQNKYGNTPLHAAAGYNNVELCNILITHGNADPNLKNGAGETPAFNAVTSLTCRLAEKPDSLQYLLETGRIDVNARDAKGNSLLHAAAYLDNVKAVELLLKSNVDKEMENHNGQTPLQVAKLNCKLVLQSS